MWNGDLFQASSFIYDDIGGAHTVNFDFVKTDHLKLSGELSSPARNGEAATSAAEFTVTVNAVAPPASEDDAGGEITLDLAFSYAGSDGAGGTAWTGTPSSPDGALTAQSVRKFLVHFDSDGLPSNQTLLDFEIN